MCFAKEYIRNQFALGFDFRSVLYSLEFIVESMDISRQKYEKPQTKWKIKNNS